MKLTGSLTTPGQMLLSKLLTGAALCVTKIVAGSGQTADSDSVLSNPCQSLPINQPTYSGQTVTIPVTLAADLAERAYGLTEIGVYANDPDVGEVLYQIYRINAPVVVEPGSGLVLRFYLQQIFSQDLNVTLSLPPAGLITETDFAPVRNAVQAINAPAKSVTVTAAGLQAYLDTLPQLLTDNLTITVSGTKTDSLSITGFYGPGSLTIQAETLGACAINSYIGCSLCSAKIRMKNLVITPPANTWGVRTGSNITLEGCQFNGNATSTGIFADETAMVYAKNCTISGWAYAASAKNGSMVCVDCAAAADAHDNVGGAYVGGGIVIFGYYTDPMLGGAAHNNQGGIVVKFNGNLL